MRLLAGGEASELVLPLGIRLLLEVDDAFHQTVEAIRAIARFAVAGCVESAGTLHTVFRSLLVSTPHPPCPGRMAVVAAGSRGADPAVPAYSTASEASVAWGALPASSNRVVSISAPGRR